VFDWVNNVDGQNKTIPNTIPLSLTGSTYYKHPKKPVNFSINTKWVGSYRPQEYDPIKGLFVFAEKKLAAYSLIRLKSTIKISDYFNLSIGVNNVNNYTNNRFGPFVGRSAYIEISSKIKKGNKQ
jgi:outer membrane receptor for ferrienterochelin and colicin